MHADISQEDNLTHTK